MSPQATATLAIIFAINIVENLALHPLSDEFIAHINALNTTWKAGRNFHPDTPLSYIKNLLGVLQSRDCVPKRTEFLDTSDLQDSFDPREKWQNCPSLNEIRDQGACGSCWALSVVEVMTDRYCISSKGQKQFHFSAEDVTSCAKTNGCSGGNPHKALLYWKENGVVSGGNYGSGEGCRPYSIKPCDHTGQDKSNICRPEVDQLNCEKTCQRNYNVSYKEDLKYAKNVNKIEGENNIMAELQKRGPVVAGFTVFDDFPSYKSGVYQRVSDKYLGLHAIKIIGWGVEGGVKYWLCANSWNTNFGDQGYFKILRGKNHCDIESDVVAGEPIVN